MKPLSYQACLRLLDQLFKREIQEYQAQRGIFLFAKKKADIVRMVAQQNWTPDMQRDFQGMVRAKDFDREVC